MWCDSEVDRGGECTCRAWREGPEHPFLLDNVWDIVMLLDYLDARPDVDSARIGMTGLSLGGMHTWLAAALDDRVAVAAPMIGVQVPADPANSACAAAGSNAHCCSRRCSPAAGAVTSVSAFCWALQVLTCLWLRHDAPALQCFGWAMEHDRWQARIASIPQVFAAAAKDLGCKAVDGSVVRRVWDCLMPGMLEVHLSILALHIALKCVKQAVLLPLDCLAILAVQAMLTLC